MTRNDGEKPLLSDELRSRERLVFGPDSVEEVSIQDINVLGQVRTEFDSAGIDELADSMLVYDGQEGPCVIVGVDLQEPAVVAKLTPEEALTYTLEHAALHKLDEPTLTRVAKDGSVYILIAGERRTRAIKTVVEYTGLDIDKTYVMCSVQEGISFLDAHRKQLTENVHDRPSAVDEAVGIRQTYDYLTMKFPGGTPSIADVSRISGRSESVVRDALAFTSLPLEIQKMAQKQKFPYVTKSGKEKERIYAPIPYSVAIKIKPLEEAYRKKYNSLDGIDESEDTYITNMLLAFANEIQKRRILIKSHGKSRVSELTAKLIENKIKDVNAEAMFSADMDGFFIEEDDSKSEQSKKNLVRAQRSLGRTAAEALHHLQKTGALTPDIIAMLATIAGQASASPNPIAEAASEVDAVFSNIAKEHPDLAPAIQ